MNNTLRVLMVEDSEDDATLLLHALRGGGYEVVHTVVNTAAEMRNALENQEWDVITSDHHMPGFSAAEALAMATELRTNLPFIIVSGAIDIDLAVSLMKEGAKDYVPKQHLPRLLPTIERELRDVKTHVERQHAEESLQARDAYLTSIIENQPGLIWLKDMKGRFLAINHAFAVSCGRETQDILGKTDLDIWPREMAEKYIADDGKVMETGRSIVVEEIIYEHSESKWFETFKTPIRDSHGNIIGTTGYARDITERKRAEESLRESEQELRAIFDGALDGILVADVGTRKIVTANAAICGMLGYTHEEIIGISVPDIHPKQDMPRMMEQFERQLRGEIQMATNAPMIRKDGTLFYADIKAAPIRIGGTDAMLGMFRDITERKLAEEALARESHRNQVFLRNASDGIHLLDPDGNVLEVSDSFCNMLGYSREELIGANVSLWNAQLSPQELKQRIAEQIEKAGRSILETRHRRRDGSLLDVEITGQGLELDGKPVLFNSARDITERIRAARELVESEVRFRGLVEQSIAGIYIIQDGKFAYVNPRFAQIFGYGSADEMIGLEPSSVVTEKDRGIVAENIRRRIEGEVANVAYDFTALRKDGSTVEVGVQGSAATYRGRPAVIGLAQDISEKKRAQEEIERYIAQLRTAFMSTVEVATVISELRDPYTTGHERRVAAIAVAIGAELGLDADRQEGLRVAGHLHDVGKITIPAEILSKPGKLSAIEFQLIQAHAQAGYEVLKNVTFPWPVAEVARQHHERMDGGGYPQGLKGEAVLLEARIMAVADVVEAMSSHRPYRPGLGIDKALTEIERGRGSAYDPVVVDACVKLFREKGYAIPA